MTAVSTICSCLIRYIKSVHLKDEESIWRRKNATFTFTLPKNYIYTLYLATMHLTNSIFGVKISLEIVYYLMWNASRWNSYRWIAAWLIWLSYAKITS